MGLFDRFKKKKEISEVKNEVTLNSDITLEALLKGEEITKEQALSIPAVASAVDKICNTISMLPIKLYKKEVKDNKTSVVEVTDDFRVKLLNDDTKDTLNGVEFKKALVEDYLLDKGGYAYIKKHGNKVISLHYVEAKNISILHNQDPINKSFHFNVNGKDYKDFEFIKVLRNTKDGSSGTSVINQVSKALETAFQEIKYQYTLLKSGGNKRGFLKAQKKLTDEALQALKDGWNKLYANDNENKCLVLNDGLEFQEASNSSVEMQLNETKKQLNQDIRNIFHDSENWNEYFKEAIQPIIAEIQCALNKDLLLEKEKESLFFAFDVKDILKGTIKERYEAYKVAKETGWITPNEIRELEKYDRIDGLDVIAMSLGNVIYDIKKKEYYTPNTDSSKIIGEGGETNEENQT